MTKRVPKNVQDALWQQRDNVALISKLTRKLNEAKARVPVLNKRVQIAIAIAKKLEIKQKAEKLAAAKLAKAEKARVAKALAAAKTTGAFVAPAGHYKMPATGAFIAYKSVHIRSKRRTPLGKAILQLLVPATATRYQAFADPYNSKLRVSEVTVLRIVRHKDLKRGCTGFNSSKHKLTSSHDHTYTYQVGATHKPANGFNTDTVQCAGGLHCFLQEKDAYDYM